jgi:hypothetical protein
MQDISIVLAVKQYNPGMLAPDFLRASGAIPIDWEVEGSPIATEQSVRVQFKNGMTIQGRPGAISFSQPFDLDRALVVAEVAEKYVSVLPNLEYLGVGINLRRFISFEGGSDGAHRYLRERIFCAAPWQDFGVTPMLAQANLVYTLEDCHLRLTIEEATLKLPDRAVPAIVFNGNFDYNVVAETVEERLPKLNQAIGKWQQDVARFQDLIDGRFSIGIEAESRLAIPVITL